MRTVLISLIDNERPGVILEITHRCPSAGEAVEALRKAVAAWGRTPQGAEAARDACDDFNWADLFDQLWPEGFVPSAWDERLESVVPLYPSGDDTIVMVDHDEILIHQEM